MEEKAYGLCRSGEIKIIMYRDEELCKCRFAQP